MDTDRASGLWVAPAAALALIALVGLTALGALWVAGGTAGVGSPALLGLWVPLVDEEAAAAGVPPALELGLIAHESGGDYLALNEDADGSADAGLTQVNSVHWPAYGLAADPFRPRRNVAAGLAILRSALDGHPKRLRAALEAYNGFGPGYASAVLAAAAALASGPALSVWPLGGRTDRRPQAPLGDLAGGLWRAPPTAGGAGAYLLITAYAPVGPPAAVDGLTWPTPEPPDRVTATQDGRPLPLALAAQAPPELRLLTPPDAAFWWAVARLPPAVPPADGPATGSATGSAPGRTVVRVTASWGRRLRRTLTLTLARA